MVTPLTAIVRRPGPRLSEGLVTHIDRTPIDLALAQSQWERYVEVFREQGWRIVEVPAADDCPDAVFVEDTAVVAGDMAVVCRPGAPERALEVVAVPDVLAAVGLDVVHLSEGFLDGGDVLKVADTVYIGVGGRTDTAGASAFGELVSTRGFRAVQVPTTKVLHLKSAVTALPDGTIIGYPPDVDSIDVFERFLAVPEPDGAHVVVLDEHSVLLAASAPETAVLLRSRGLDVVTVDIAEFIRLEGCVTCLSIRVRGGDPL